MSVADKVMQAHCLLYSTTTLVLQHAKSKLVEGQVSVLSPLILFEEKKSNEEISYPCLENREESECGAHSCVFLCHGIDMEDKQIQLFQYLGTGR